eukprot:6419672-Prymnesium_polylepis.1
MHSAAFPRCRTCPGLVHVRRDRAVPTWILDRREVPCEGEPVAQPRGVVVRAPHAAHRRARGVLADREGDAALGAVRDEIGRDGHTP